MPWQASSARAGTATIDQLVDQKAVRGARGLQGKALERLRAEHIGRLFQLASRLFERLAMEELRREGFSDLRLVHLALIRSLPAEGMRTSEIGEVAGMTKQAVGQLAIELERAGYVRRVPDPADGRAKIVRYADRGHALMASIPAVLTRAEKRIEDAIGHDDFIVLRRTMKRMLSASALDLAQQ